VFRRKQVETICLMIQDSSLVIVWNSLETEIAVYWMPMGSRSLFLCLRATTVVSYRLFCFLLHYDRIFIKSTTLLIIFLYSSVQKCETAEAVLWLGDCLGHGEILPRFPDEVSGCTSSLGLGHKEPQWDGDPFPLGNGMGPSSWPLRYVPQLR